MALLTAFQRGQIVHDGIQILERELLVKALAVQRPLHQARRETFHHHGVWFENGLTDVVGILAGSNIPQARPDKLVRAIEFMTRDTAPLLHELLPRRAAPSGPTSCPCCRRRWPRPTPPPPPFPAPPLA